MRERPGFGLAAMWRWTGGPVACPLLGKATAACFLAGIGMVLWMPALPLPWLRWAALLAGLVLWVGSRVPWSGALLAGAGWAALQAGWAGRGWPCVPARAGASRCGSAPRVGSPIPVAPMPSATHWRDGSSPPDGC